MAAKCWCTGKNLRLHRRAERDDLVRVELGVEALAAKERRDERTHRRNAGRTAYHDHFIDLSRGVDAGVAQRLADGGRRFAR